MKESKEELHKPHHAEHDVEKKIDHIKPGHPHPQPQDEPPDDNTPPKDGGGH